MVGAHAGALAAGGRIRGRERGMGTRRASPNAHVPLIAPPAHPHPQPPDKRPAASSKVVFLVVAYSICSSMLLILNKARPLLPNKNTASHVWDNLELLGIKFPRAPIEYEPDHGKRYLIKKLYIMDWVQLDKEDPDQNDVWSLYLPPRV